MLYIYITYRVITLNLFKSYISDRYQCIEFDVIISD